MIGKFDLASKQIDVVGAGFSGLALAYQLDKAGFEVTLYEKSGRAGGLIQTFELEQGLSESAANSLLVSPSVMEFCQELGVEMVAVNKDSKARYILRDGKLKKMPLRLSEIVEMVFRVFFKRAPQNIDPQDMTMDLWAEHFLGRAAHLYLLNPFLRGVYGARPQDILVSIAFPNLVVPKGQTLFFWMLKKAFFGLKAQISEEVMACVGYPKLPKVKAKPREMMTPKMGIGALIQALESKLKQSLGNRYIVGNSGWTYKAQKNIALCTSAHDAAKLIGSVAQKTSDVLSAVKYCSMVSVTVFASKTSLKTPLKGVGLLIPEIENRKILGILFNSSSFVGRVKDQDKVESFTVMMGGSSQPEAIGYTDQQIKDIIKAEFQEHFGLEGELLSLKINRWEKAIPQYGPDLKKLYEVASMDWSAIKGRVLFGNYSGQVSLRGMIDTVKWGLGLS